MPPPRKKESETSVEISDRVRSILETKGLTLYQISRQSGALFGKSSPYFIPHNLYYDLRNPLFSPCVHQIFAFSQISGYRFRDWLGVFGLDLETITSLRVRLFPRRTMLLDTSLIDPKDWVSWFRNRQPQRPMPSIAPLSQLLDWTLPRRIETLYESSLGRYLYAKIGREDDYAFPETVPGSIVRVDAAAREQWRLGQSSEISNRIFLIEHSRGLCCCRLRVPKSNIILPVSTLLPYAQVELEYPREARILGAVDFELRPLLKNEEPFVPSDLARRWKPRRLANHAPLGALLRQARGKMHLSLREASVISRTIAEHYNDPRYAVSASSLYEYEVFNTLPRDLHRVITLCALYGLQFRSVLESIGIHPNEEECSESIPDHLIPPFSQTKSSESPSDDQASPPGFLEQLLHECQEFPIFLRNSIEYFDDRPNISLGDFFWIGGEPNALHPSLAQGLVALVNRRKRAPIHFTSRAVWQQPVYIIAKRDETYLAACCGIEDGTLVIHSYGHDLHGPTQFRAHQDAEVIGQIVAVARKIE